MGSSNSQLVKQEKTSWVLGHQLNYNEDLRREQLKEVDKFGHNLQLCYVLRQIMGFEYNHWWVTDGTRVIEFGGAELGNHHVLVSINPPKLGTFVTESNFKLTGEVKERMKKVCGASNYSLALRNCEHVARYIHCGAWLCFQMVGNGVLKQLFVDHMSEFTKKINTFPDELVQAELEKTPLYPQEMIDAFEEAGTVKWTRTKGALIERDAKLYNIVFIGPTGSGKSHLINNLFNLTVCASEASIDSVTKEVKFYEGMARNWIMDSTERGMERKQFNRSINIIDTLGFCDSVMSPEDVLDAIKMSVKVNMTHIDKVVVVCSGRIEQAHNDSIENFLKWLNFTENRDKFIFIYNKSDLMSLLDKQKNLLAMCEKFDVNIDQKMSWLTKTGPEMSIKTNLAIGFPPGATFNDVATDHVDFSRSVLAGTQLKNSRIKVSKSSCTIL